MKATGFIKRHDRLGRSTSLSLELENSLETTVHLIIWVPDPILFTWQCLSILSLFFFLDIVDGIEEQRALPWNSERKRRNEESCAATWVHCSKVVRFAYYISFQEQSDSFYKENYQTSLITHTRHTRYPQSWKSWKFEVVCQLLYFGTLISSFFL